MNAGDPAQLLVWRQLAAMLPAAGRGVTVAEPLSRLTTLRIGGAAGLVCRIENADQARRFLELAETRAVPWTCLGGGSNVLADDAGFAGMVMLVRCGRFEVRGDTVRAGAGWDFDALIAATLHAGLTGLEFASGIPGTLGGALVGNAGCYGREISEFTREVTVLRADGRVETIGPDDLAFGYRTSALKDRRDVVLEMVLQLDTGDIAAASATRDEHIADRRRKHPWEEPSAGSYFKNLPPLEPGGRRRPAGALLEAVGAKQMREGGATVFPRHANIIINSGGATCRDVLTLARRMKDAVHEHFGEHLEAEVRHLVTPGASPGPAWD